MQVEIKNLIVTITTTSIIVLGITALLVLILTNQKRNRKRHAMEKQAMQNTFQQEILKTQLETQEYAFHQISEELHDNVGQLLSTTKMLIGITERNLKQPPDSLKTASETLGKAIQDLRSLSKSLSNEWLHQFNIVDNLRAELDRLNAARQVEVSFTTNSKMLPLEPQQQVMLFRVMQEALQNSIKHAEASAISVSIQLGENTVFLCLSDNGAGFNTASAAKTGLGLMNMKHRVKLLGGSIEWISDINNGTKVEINLPVQKAEI